MPYKQLTIDETRTNIELNENYGMTESFTRSNKYFPKACWWCFNQLNFALSGYSIDWLKDEAYDIAIDAVALFQKKEKILPDIPGSRYEYLRKICMTKCVNYLRKNLKHIDTKSSDEIYEKYGETEPEDEWNTWKNGLSAEDEYFIELPKEKLKELLEKERVSNPETYKILELRFFEGKTLEEIAKIMEYRNHQRVDKRIKGFFSRAKRELDKLQYKH